MQPAGRPRPTCTRSHSHSRGTRWWASAGAGQGSTGNAAKAGIKAGDTIIYTSSFFGEELWPADKLSFTNNAVTNCPSPVTFVYVSVVCVGGARPRPALAWLVRIMAEAFMPAALGTPPATPCGSRAAHASPPFMASYIVSHVLDTCTRAASVPSKDLAVWFPSARCATGCMHPGAVTCFIVSPPPLHKHEFRAALALA